MLITVPHVHLEIHCQSLCNCSCEFLLTPSTYYHSFFVITVTWYLQVLSIHPQLMWYLSVIIVQHLAQNSSFVNGSSSTKCSPCHCNPALHRSLGKAYGILGYQSFQHCTCHKSQPKWLWFLFGSCGSSLSWRCSIL